ncbi:MAG: 1-acyl-sn-glycerol-3-phosphate acyltransferase [Anaerolineae bacterium]|nr:1-acyl-sn-glycerol-3-phosphate acyltransferase [Anaerolineae bacterium]
MSTRASMIADPVAWVSWQRDTFRWRRHFFQRVLFDRLVRPLLVDLTVEGMENLPSTGPTVLMMNHVTAVDPVIVIGITRPRYVVPMSKVENFRDPVAGLLARSWGAYPVKRGEVDRAALRVTLELLKAGELVLMAPEGTRSPSLKQAKDGLAYLLVKADPATVIIPAAVWDLETWGRDLITPWRRTPVQVRFGQPFRLKLDGQRRVPRESLRQITDEMMYQLAVTLPERYRGDYSDLDQMTTEMLEFV